MVVERRREEGCCWWFATIAGGEAAAGGFGDAVNLNPLPRNVLCGGTYVYELRHPSGEKGREERRERLTWVPTFCLPSFCFVCPGSRRCLTVDRGGVGFGEGRGGGDSG